MTPAQKTRKWPSRALTQRKMLENITLDKPRPEPHAGSISVPPESDDGVECRPIDICGEMGREVATGEGEMNYNVVSHQEDCDMTDDFWISQDPDIHKLSTATSMGDYYKPAAEKSFLLPTLDIGSDMTALGNRGQSDNCRNGGTETFEGDKLIRNEVLRTTMCDTDDIAGAKTSMYIAQQRVDKRGQQDQSECEVMSGAVGDAVTAEYGEKYTNNVQQEVCVDSMKEKRG